MEGKGLSYGRNIKLVGRADRVEDDVVMMFKKSRENLKIFRQLNTFIQINAYLYIFNKEEGVIIYFDNERK